MKEKRKGWTERKLLTMRICRNLTESLVSGLCPRPCLGISLQDPLPAHPQWLGTSFVALDT